MRKLKRPKQPYVWILILFLLFSSQAWGATVSIQDGEDWSLPSWITGWSPYGGVYGPFKDPDSEVGPPSYTNPHRDMINVGIPITTNNR